MEGLHPCGAGRSCALDPSDIQFQQTSTRLNALSVSAEQSAEITIRTDEGDTVVLSSREHAEADLLTYEHLSCTRQGFDRQAMQQIDCAVESEITLAVQGNLNDQEMADIQAFLKDLGGMLKAFLSGADEDGGALQAAGGLAGFESLSAFQADFEYRVRTNYLSFEADRLSLSTAAGPGRPAALEPDSAGDPSAAAIDGPEDEAGPVAARMAKRARAAGFRGHRWMKHFERFLESVLQEMLAGQAIDAEQARRGQNVIERFLEELGTPAAGVEVQMSRAAFHLTVFSYAYEATGRAAVEPALIQSA